MLALLIERDIADLGAPDITLQDVQHEWRGGEFDLRVDARVAETATRRIVGYAVTTRAGAMVAVAPDHEGHGIGTRLRHWAEQHDRERGREHHRQAIAADNERGRALLLAAGYRQERSYWRLVRKLDRVEENGAPPAGISLSPVNLDEDPAAVHALHAVSFKANADYRPYSLAAFCEAHLQAPDFDPELSCVARCGDQPIGFLLAWRWREENIGFVDLLGIHPDQRGRGLGTAMLKTAFARFAAAGLDEAQLGVASDNPNALRLYERCGMTERFRYDTYRRPVAQAGDET